MPQDASPGFVSTKITCTDCGKDSRHVVKRIVALDQILCGFCNGAIHLRPHRARLEDIVKRYAALDEFLG